MYNSLIVNLEAFQQNLLLAFKLSLRVKKKEAVLEQMEQELSPSEKIKQLTSKGFSDEIIPVLKCNAYGVGAQELSLVCKRSGIEKVAVVRLNEAMEIKDVAPNILIMNALPEEELETAIKNDFILTAYLKEHLEQIDKIAMGVKKQVKVHLKINSGMNRFGVDVRDINDFFQSVKKAENIKVESLFTHYHNAFNSDPSYTQKQFDLFQEVLTQFGDNVHHHMGNSAALMHYPQFISGTSRPGIMLYGSYPSEWMVEKYKEMLKPVVELKSRVIQVRSLKKGEYVGYGEWSMLEEDAIIALIPIGYGDGYHRNATKNNYVLINKKPFHLFGTVSMDSLTIKVDESVKVGDEVILFGGNQKGAPSVDETAKEMGIIPYELLTGINSRVERKYLYGKG
ncbi:MAG: alanine racemase [Nitrospinae bacterium]|nr:alanine racemase [Nitrospinota bacterium]